MINNIDALEVATICRLSCPMPSFVSETGQVVVLLTKGVRDALALNLLDYTDASHMEREEAISSGFLPAGSNSSEEAKAVPMILEDDFYLALLKSQTPASRPFKRWLTNAVLPDIEADGAFLCRKVAEQITPKHVQLGCVTISQAEFVTSYFYARATKIVRAARAWVGLPCEHDRLPDSSFDVVGLVETLAYEASNAR